MAMCNNRGRAVDESTEEWAQESFHSPAASHHGPVAPPIATLPRSVVPGDGIGTQSPVPLWSIHHQTPGAYHQPPMSSGVARARSTDFFAPQTLYPSFPANDPDNSTMMGLGHLVIPSASFNVPAPYIPLDFHDVEQPPFAFSRKGSLSRHGSLPSGAVSIYFEDKDGQYPGIQAVRDSTCLRDRDDTVLRRMGDFPPTNATWPNCRAWSHIVEFRPSKDGPPATRGILYDRIRHLVLNKFQEDCEPDLDSTMGLWYPDPSQLKEEQLIIKELRPVTRGSWRIELAISMP